jgi:hypothetical protein
LSNIYQIRLMGFEKGKQGRQQAALAGPGAEFIGTQAGEVKEPPGAAFVGQGRGQCGQRQCLGIAGFIVCPVA